MEITNDDIDILIEALTAWESKDLSSDMMMSLIGAVFLDNKDEVAKVKWESDEAKRKLESEKLSKLRKEQSVLLKAKLIQMKQEKAILKLNE